MTDLLAVALANVAHDYRERSNAQTGGVRITSLTHVMCLQPAADLLEANPHVDAAVLTEYDRTGNLGESLRTIADQVDNKQASGKLRMAAVPLVNDPPVCNAVLAELEGRESN